MRLSVKGPFPASCLALPGSFTVKEHDFFLPSGISMFVRFQHVKAPCQIPKFYKVIEVTRFGTVIWRVRGQGKGIASLDRSDGDAASTY